MRTLWPLVAAAGLGLIAAATLLPGHLTFTPDSMRYLDVAAQVAGGEGATSYHLNLSSRTVPARLGLWAPLYPTALGGLLALGLGRAAATLATNLVALGLLLLATWRLGRLLGLGPFARLLVAALLLAHPYVRLVWGFAWSEPLFVGLLYLSLACTLEGLGPSPRLLPLLLGGILGGAAFATRYAGLFLPALVLPALAVVGLRRWRAGRTLLAAAAWTLPALAIAWLAVAPNLRAFGSPFGPDRPAPGAPLAFLLRRLHQMLASLEGAVAGLPVLLLAAFLLLSLRRREPDRGPGPAEPAAPARALFLLAWALLYSGGLLASLARVVTSPIGARYLLPVVPALVLAAAFLLRRHLDPGPLRPRRRVAALGLAALLVLAGWVDAAGVRRNAQLEPAPRQDAIAAWARPRGGPDVLFVGHGLWWLRFREGPVVLEGGDHANPPLTAGAVAAWLRGPGRRFRTVHLLFQAGPEMGLDDREAFLAALPPDRWEAGAPETVIPRDTVAVTLRRR